MTVATTVAATMAPCAAPAQDQPPEADRRLQSVEQEMRESRAREDALQRRADELTREIGSLRDEMVAAARATQTQEEALSHVEDELAALRQDEATKQNALDRRRTELAGTLAALQRLAIHPPEALIVSGRSAKDTVRSALLLRTIIPHIEQNALALSGELATLMVLRAEISRQRIKVRNAAVALENEQERLAALVDRKARMQVRTEAERARVASRLKTLAARAKDLRDLIARLAKEVPVPLPKPNAGATGADVEVARLLPPQGLRRFADGQGEITLPVRGRVTRVFDESANAGTYNKGLVIKARAGAQVVAPYDGQVVFAGPFRGYGQILIIEHGEGYHTLLAGLQRIDGAANQWLLAGEPVGVLGGSRSEPPTLYLEIRHNGRPIDPLPWLAVDQTKVSG